MEKKISCFICGRAVTMVQVQDQRKWKWVCSDCHWRHKRKSSTYENVEPKGSYEQ